LTTASDTFLITISNSNPTITGTISDVSYHLGTKFEIIVPKNLFTDTENDPITYSATSSGGGALPTWLSFEADSKVFHAYPLLPAHLGSIIKI
jgi:hypothetical protein